MKRLAVLAVAPPVPSPLVPEGWGVVVVVLDKPEIAEFAELMTEEREEREELTPDGSEEIGDDNEDGIGVNPLNVVVAGKEVV